MRFQRLCLGPSVAALLISGCAEGPNPSASSDVGGASDPLFFDDLGEGTGAGRESLPLGMIMTVTAMTRDFPASTGLPTASLDALLWARELPGIRFNSENTPKAPFVRPGLEYMLASFYAQLGMREEYTAQLEVVAAQDGYEDWAWYDFVEAQRADPDRLLAKFASFGEDEYSDSYASSNSGCLFCHGGI